ncbi:MAG: aldose 1-epimerase family protein [Eubacteriales bacterium]|nr:aldose 1-epimerase family protein [Eubacteriales bacterium]
MGFYSLKNGDLSALFISTGAELKSLKDCKTGREYMWNANPDFWKRTSPVLFPLVGNYKNKEIRHNGHVYSLPQHGFARDMEFELISLTQSEIWFGLSSSPETLRKYPFLFRLEIGYKLEERSLKVIWRVVNKGKETMYFSIGGHPAFVCPLKKDEKQSDYYLLFDANQEVVSRRIGGSGLATDTLVPYALEDGYLRIAEDLFDFDALVIENHQAQKVSLCTPDKKPYVTVSFDAPLFGVWSVPGKSAPFVCIEPWYGRCDHENFSGTLQDREWGNALDAFQSFETQYSIEI